jgi:c-di-GMP-binding flagellar brake protein YcgR
MTSLGDRRVRVRLEVVGALRGTLEVPATARLVNISHSGALIELPLAVPVDSTQIVHFTVNGTDVPVEARVRHVRQAGGERRTDYLVGVEFVSAPLAVVQHVEKLATRSSV